MDRSCLRCVRRLYAPGKPTPGAVISRARGLCNRCWIYLNNHDQLAEYPRLSRSRDDLLDDYVILREQGYSWRLVAERLGMKYPTFERAMCRARKDGDPRAGRPGERWPPIRPVLVVAWRPVGAELVRSTA